MSRTGIQSYWNYETFSLLGPHAGRSQAEAVGFINTYTQNLCFTQTDIVMKMHNNNPILSRCYNSHTTSEDAMIKEGGIDGASFVGTGWMLNVEHCLITIEEGEEIQQVYEIDPTGARNQYAPQGGGAFQSEEGNYKDLTYDSGTDTFEITTRDYYTYRFSPKSRSSNFTGVEDTKFYGLDWIKDRHGVMVIVGWDSNDRLILNIQGAPSQTEYEAGNAIGLIAFDYATQGDGYKIVNYRINHPLEELRENTLVWTLTYDEEPFYLVNVEYPTGGIFNDIQDENLLPDPIPTEDCSYSFSYLSGKLNKITDMNGVQWVFTWDDETNPPSLPADVYHRLTRQIYGVGKVPGTDSPFSTMVFYISAITPNIAYVKDPIPQPGPGVTYWQYDHDTRGRLEIRTDLLSNVTRYVWSGIGSGKWTLDEYWLSNGSHAAFEYNADKCLQKIRWYDNTPSEHTVYNRYYEYHATDKYLVTKVRFDETSDGNGWWSTTEFEYEDKLLMKTTIGKAPSGSTGDDIITPAVTTYTYDQYGNVLTMTGPEGKILEFEYYTDWKYVTVGSDEPKLAYLDPHGISNTGFGGIKSAHVVGDPGPGQKLTWLLFDVNMCRMTGAGPAQEIWYSPRGEVVHVAAGSGYLLNVFLLYDKMSNPKLIWHGDRKNWIYFNYRLDSYPINMPILIARPGDREGSLNLKKTEYDERGQLTASIFKYDGDEYRTDFTYDAVGNLTDIIKEVVSGGATVTVSYQYDSLGNITQFTNIHGTSTTHEYNFIGQLEATRYSAPVGYVNDIEYTYDQPMGMLGSIDRITGLAISPDTATWTYEYDRMGRIIKWTSPSVPSNSTQQFTVEYYYDRASNIIARKNTRTITNGGPTETYRLEKYEYDWKGRLANVYEDLGDDYGTNYAFKYDNSDQVIQTSRDGLIQTRNDFDEFGNLIAIYKPGQDPETEGTRYIYDCGKLQQVIRAGRIFRTFEYDDAGRVTKIGDGEGNSWQREYWENGQLKRLIKPSGDFIGYEYDGLGRIVKVWETIPDIDLATATIADNPWGIDRKSIALTCQVGYSTDTDMNGGYGLKVTYRTTYSATSGTPWTYEYYNTEYKYNQWGHLEQVSYPATGSTSTTAAPAYRYQYDLRGNMTSVEYWNSTGGPPAWETIIECEYDLLDRKLQMEYAEFVVPGSPTLNVTNDYSYCCCSLLTATQTNSTANTSTRSLSYDFNKGHQLQQERYVDVIPTTGSPATITKDYNYQWTNAGQLTRFEDPVFGANDDHPSIYRRDGNSSNFKVERIDDSAPRIADAESYQYELDSLGRVTRLSMPGDPGEEPDTCVLSIEYEYDGNDHLVSLLATDLINDEVLYNITYGYNTNSQMTSMSVKKSRYGRAFVYRARYWHDGRGQITREVYDSYVSGTKTVTRLKEVEREYDLAGNMTRKNITDSTYSWQYSFGYDTGYRLTAISAVCNDGANLWTYAYTLSHDLRGNLQFNVITVIPTMPPPPLPEIDLPVDPEYDAHNRLVEYTGNDSGTALRWRLYWDPIGRVFRKESYEGNDPEEIVAATHYYYRGRKLVQEYDEMVDGETAVDEIEFDYLRGLTGEVIRRRQNTPTGYKDRLHVNDAQGTVKEEGEPDMYKAGTRDGFVVGSDGVPIDPPAEDVPNHIQFHGGFLEQRDFINPSGTNKGYLYRMGVRHYIPALERFLQRDPMNIYRAPGAGNPLRLNPYIYAMNQPLEFKDTSGYCPCGGGFGGGSSGGGGASGGWGGTDGGTSGGTGAEDPPGSDPGDAGDGDSDCTIDYDDDTWCQACLPCCVPPDTPVTPCEPCVELNYAVLCLSTLPHDQDCICECCKKRNGGDNAPTPQPGSKPSNSSGGIWFRPLGPPRFGPDQKGPWGWDFWPLLPYPKSPDFIPVFMLKTSSGSALISQPLDQMFVYTYKTPKGFSTIGISIQDGIGWLINPPDWRDLLTLGEDYACNSLLSNYNHCNRDDEYLMCLVAACCAYMYCKRVTKPISDVCFWVGVIGIWYPPAAAVAGVVSSAVFIACQAALVTALASCEAQR